MHHRHRVLTLALSLGLAVLTVNCPKQAVQTPPEPPPEPVRSVEPAPEPEAVEVPPEPFPTTEVETAPAPEPTLAELNQLGVLTTVHFAFDSYELDEEARMTLQRNAQWLRENSGHAIRVEGHCDERGTIEYNLALGERRASTVRDYLVSLGVGASRIRIVSYGEEQPADSAHNEGAWSRNRRAQFLFES